MNNLLVTWALPLERIGGSALVLADFNGTEVSLSADGGANFSAPVLVAPGGTQEFKAADLPTAHYIVRLAVVLVDGTRSVDLDTPFSILDDSPPNTVTNVEVILT